MSISVNAWITGLSTGGGDGGNDIDDGTTTLESGVYDLSSIVDPVVRYARWFTNDQGSSPGLDSFDVEVASNGGGTNWALLEQISGGTPLEWVEVEIPLAGAISPTSTMRFRFTALDELPGSLVEAGIDDFELVDPGQGCAGCATPVMKPAATDCITKRSAIRFSRCPTTGPSPTQPPCAVRRAISLTPQTHTTPP